jgi:hypothetical protein
VLSHKIPIPIQPNKSKGYAPISVYWSISECLFNAQHAIK